MTNSTDHVESGWVLVGVQGPNTAIVINFFFNDHRGARYAHTIEELSPPIEVW